MVTTGNSSASAQFILDLPLRPALGRDDFLVTASNEAAVMSIERWPNWHNPLMIITGPEGSGKSHLGAVWQSLSAAKLIDAAELREPDVPRLMSDGALLIEDAPGAELDERALFHAINYAREHGRTILVTTHDVPARWSVALPDLVSRLRAAEVVELHSPDDALLRGVLVKQFNDRQILVDERIVAYMVNRMERSFSAIRTLVAEIDRRALAERANVTRPFVARVMADLAGEDHQTEQENFIE